jgi:hypothetical protein
MGGISIVKPNSRNMIIDGNRSEKLLLEKAAVR